MIQAHWQTYLSRYPIPIVLGASLVGFAIGRRSGRAPAGQSDRLAARAGEWAGSDAAQAISASLHRLGARVEELVDHAIDEVATATERSVVPALVRRVERLFDVKGGPAPKPSRPPTSRERATADAIEGELP